MAYRRKCSRGMSKPWTDTLCYAAKLFFFVNYECIGYKIEIVIWAVKYTTYCSPSTCGQQTSSQIRVWSLPKNKFCTPLCYDNYNFPCVRVTFSVISQYKGTQQQAKETVEVLLQFNISCHFQVTNTLSHNFFFYFNHLGPEILSHMWKPIRGNLNTNMTD